MAAGDRCEVLLGSLRTVDEPLQIGRPEPEADARDAIEDDPPFRAEAIQGARIYPQGRGRLSDFKQISVIVHGNPLAAGLDKLGVLCLNKNAVCLTACRMSFGPWRCNASGLFLLYHFIIIINEFNRNSQSFKVPTQKK